MLKIAKMSKITKMEMISPPRWFEILTLFFLYVVKEGKECVVDSLRQYMLGYVRLGKHISNTAKCQKLLNGNVISSVMG